MPETLGAHAYAAYWQARHATHAPWAALKTDTQRAWEAAAQAVLTAAAAARIIHLRRGGAPLCGFSQQPPHRWPLGHFWSEYHADITCVACQADPSFG